MKKRITKTVAFAMIMMCFQIPETGYAEDIDYNKMNMYAMETIIAQPEKIENEWVRLDGYAKFEENGVALYKTEKDYKYDTKENAVWLPEREEASIEKRFGGPEKQIDGSAWAISAVIQPVKKDSPYAAEAMYVIDESDKIWQNAKPQPEKRKKYNRENEKEEAERVSIYRLLGDPWSYDGKKVCVDVRGAHEGGYNFSSEDRYLTLEWTDNVYGEWLDFDAAWKEIVEEYKQDERFKNTDADVQFYVECAAYLTMAQMETEMMFYMYNVDVNRASLYGNSVHFACWPCKITISEVDQEKWKKEIQNLYEQDIERGRLTISS